MSLDQAKTPFGLLRHVSARAVAYMELSRLPQTIVVALGTLIGFRLFDAMVGYAMLVLVVFSNVVLFMGATAINDACDLTEDLVNKPGRPLPSGRISPGAAVRFAVACLATGVITAWAVTAWLGAAAFVIAAASAAYAIWLKRVPFVGNIVVAAVSTYPLYCWIALGGRPDRLAAHVVVAFFVFRVGAELIKTAEDYAGDRHAGIRTAATVFGAAAANRVGSVLLCVSLGMLAATPGLDVPVMAGLAISAALAASAVVLSFRQVSFDRGRQMIFIQRAIIVVMISVFTAQALFTDLQYLIAAR